MDVPTLRALDSATAPPARWWSYPSYFAFPRRTVRGRQEATDCTVRVSDKKKQESLSVTALDRVAAATPVVWEPRRLRHYHDHGEFKNLKHTQ